MPTCEFIMSVGCSPCSHWGEPENVIYFGIGLPNVRYSTLPGLKTICISFTRGFATAIHRCPPSRQAVKSTTGFIQDAIDQD